ncbi:MAG TPA: SLBB domain-containing protein [Terriglobales bacterium]|nr:SLBB domain-containing protein [Terriglobales bacterium]
MRKSVLKLPIIYIVALVLQCAGLYGQMEEGPRGPKDASQAPRPVGLSDLAKDNLNRVAASATQIREVLVKDAGLLVELKRWVAKEASDNGQVVEDGDLTDQAIFERLDRDIVFRSVATRLLQRYGYLLPTPNPESDFAKEQDLVLKERARRLVQIEAQEDSQALQPQKPKQDQEEQRSTACDMQRGEICDQTPNRRSLRSRESEPPTPPEINPFFPPLVPPVSQSPQLLRTDLTNAETGQSDGLRAQSALALQFGSPRSGVDGMSSGEMANSSGLSSSMLFGLSPGFLTPDAMTGNGLDPLLAGKGYANQTLAKADIPQRSQHIRLPSVGSAEADVTPVKMVRPPNPYADVPSLYDMYVQPGARQRPAERFGLDVFRNSPDEPDVIPMDLPVGPDYTVGPGDSLAIDLWGGVSQRLVRLVDREGRISLPEAGPMLVSGKTLADVQLSVQRLLRTQFRDVSADVSLSRLRTVRVYVVGDVVEPGAYDISSLSTPLNALFAAGGVTPRGSLRSLKHYRGKELVQEVDAYDLLLHGVRSDLKRLENGDTLLVPPLGPQITIEGMVRRPAVYELLNEHSLAEALELAGGILPTGALRHIEVQRIEQHEKRTMLALDISSTDTEAVSTQLAAFKISDGDQVQIFPIAAYNQDTIYVQGHVVRPGKYSYKQGMRVTDLISSYSDLLPEPAPHYAEIIRLNPPDFHPSIESFDLSGALANPASAPPLRPMDTVRIFSRYAFEPPPDVWVGGEVRTPGNYRTSGQAHLRDAIYLAGGLTPDASLSTVQLVRTQPDGTMKILSVDLREALAGDPMDNIVLQPRDRVLVHKNPAMVEAPTVYIKGEVVKPGRYSLTDNMRVNDLVRVAGGLKRSAYADQADLTRYAATNLPSRSNEILEVQLAAALGGDGNQNLPLQNGDVLTIRQIPNWNELGASVTARGEVQHPATYGIVPGERLSSILRRSGGFTNEAYPYGAILMRREVRELEMKSHQELIHRINLEESYLKTLPEGDADQKNAKLTAIAQTQTTLRQLEATEPVGRVVVHIPADLKDWPGSPADVVLRDGDELIIPKKANYVMVNGQVFNPTAVSCLPGKSAKWYLGQAGGLTQLADKKGLFVVRADGSVISAKNNSGFWSGDPMGAVLKAGDTIVVPEKAPKIGTRNWQLLMQSAQVASSIGLAVAYLHP